MRPTEIGAKMRADGDSLLSREEDGEERIDRMTYHQFVSLCDALESMPEDQLCYADLYREEDWGVEDRRRLCALHRALESLDPFASDAITEEDEERAFDHWWGLPGREELKLEVWRQVYFEGPCKRFEATDVNQLSPEARETYFEILDSMREDATAFALGIVPGSDEWRRFLAGGNSGDCP